MGSCGIPEIEAVAQKSKSAPNWARGLNFFFKWKEIIDLWGTDKCFKGEFLILFEIRIMGVRDFIEIFK